MLGTSSFGGQTLHSSGFNIYDATYDAMLGWKYTALVKVLTKYYVPSIGLMFEIFAENMNSV